MIKNIQSLSPKKNALLRFLPAAVALSCTMSASPVWGSSNEQNDNIPFGIDLQQDSIIQEGKTRFIQTCAYCHGQEGEAGKTRPFKTHTDWDPQAIFDTISNGRRRGGNIMPTWKDSIPPEEIWKLVAYIKSLSAPKKEQP